jgi:hypothetical protein
MSFTAVVENGTIKIPAEVNLADGTTVIVEAQTSASAIAAETGTFVERYADLIGIWEDGPADLAAQHDHYASGAPKRGS